MVTNPETKDQPEILTAQEVADWLRVTIDTVYVWCKSNKIPHLRIPGQYRFVRADILAWGQPPENNGSKKIDLPGLNS